MVDADRWVDPDGERPRGREGTGSRPPEGRLRADGGAPTDGRESDGREVGLLGLFAFLLKAAFVTVGVAGVAGYYLAYRALTEPWIVVDGTAETVLGPVSGATGIVGLSWPNPFWLLAGTLVGFGCLFVAHPPWGLRIQPMGLGVFSAGFLVVHYTGGAPAELGPGVYFFVGTMLCTLFRVGELAVYNELDDRGLLRIGPVESDPDQERNETGG